MLTLDYGGSPDTRSLCPLSLTANPGGWDALFPWAPSPLAAHRHPRASPTPPGTTPGRIAHRRGPPDPAHHRTRRADLRPAPGPRTTRLRPPPVHPGRPRPAGYRL